MSEQFKYWRIGEKVTHCRFGKGRYAGKSNAYPTTAGFILIENVVKRVRLADLKPGWPKKKARKP